ncbi:VOC family protein [Paenibacillus xanthanilyticus]|uniref:VOC family protein n=1 Tax=Paenibacillus xanthanilyticus TaxID=1783531 RepID=A0ABV8JWV4_9BACL
MATLTPYIFSEDAKAQAGFYTEALGGEILSLMTFAQLPDADEATKDKVLHMAFVAGGVQFFMSDSPFNAVTRGSGMHLSLEFPSDAEAHDAFDKLSAGGRVVDPLKQQFWGSLFGVLEDKFGVLWQVTTPAPSAQG